MLEIKQVKDISANHRMTFEALYYSSMRDLKHIEHKIHQMVSRLNQSIKKLLN